LLDFEDAERIAFGIDEIDLPASVGDGEVGQGDDSAQPLDGFRGSIKVFDFA
jgi:translation elongation factor EF-1beta